jgi:uncharacterized protein YbjT (DUF2867 family)
MPMFVIMGATGHVGSAVADTLLARGLAVTILTRHPQRATAWTRKGADVVQADADDAESLRRAFRQGRRAFILNPPADPGGDTGATERRTIATILSALDGSGLEKLVAASSYGAQAGEAIGDLSTLWCLEQGLQAQPIPTAINRGAYYMSNWLTFADAVRAEGVLPSMFPADAEIPMVAPADLGRVAAERLLSDLDDTQVRFVEGPARYTPQDVANAFAAALGRDVRVEVAPRDQWESIYRRNGFSPAAARAYTRMTAVSLDQDFSKPASPTRGTISLRHFIAASMDQHAHR